MLTRLRVDGFKNLSGVDVRLGPFTCVAGANGVGKSNLFDAIEFLSLLANHTLVEAARAVRSKGDRTTDVRLLFRHQGASFHPRMTFEAEMLVQESTIDDLGQRGTARATFLVYSLTLAYRESAEAGHLLPGGLEIVSEKLTYVPKSEADEHLRFEHSREWRDSVVKGASRRPFISTVDEGGRTLIRLHQDGNQGRPTSHAAATLPRTVLSRASASESPTALCARREMASWTMLQLEPSALRRPSPYGALDHVGADGANLVAALHRIATRGANEMGLDTDAVYAQIANRLSELIGDVREVSVDHDDKRELLTLLLRDRSDTTHPAQSLSDGTLRFLALAVIELDPESGGVLCLEEPENGIHPERIPAMLRLLNDMTVDTEHAVDRDNPMRQVLVNTHSPVVVQEVDDATLLVADAVWTAEGGRGARFAWLPNTWRQDADPNTLPIPKGKLLAYLGYAMAEPRAAVAEETGSYRTAGHSDRRRVQRVCERDDLCPYLPGLEGGA